MAAVAATHGFAEVGLPGQRALPPWKRHIALQLKQRDRAQKTRYKHLIQSYNQLLEKSCLLKHIAKNLPAESAEASLYGAHIEVPLTALCSGIEAIERRHQEKVSDIKTFCGELAVEILENRKTLKEKQGTEEDQMNRQTGLDIQLQIWNNKHSRCLDRVDTQDNVNLELKRGYDDLLKATKSTEEKLREAEVEHHFLVEEILAYKNLNAEHQNEMNERVKRKNEKIERKRARAAMHLVPGKAKPATVNCKKNCSENPEGQKPIQRSQRSASASEIRTSKLPDFLKRLTEKPRSNSFHSFGEERLERYPFRATCAHSRVPSRALCVLDTLDSEVNAVKFSPNSKLLALGGANRHIDLWDIVGGSLQTLKTLVGSNSSIISVEFDPSGRHILAASYDKAAHLWHINQSDPKDSLTGHTRKVTAAKFMSTIHRAVTCSWDRTVKEWDLTRGTCLSTINVPSYCSDVVCSDYYIISGHHDGKIRLWDCRRKHCVTEIPLDGKITSLHLNYCETQLLSCSRDDELNVIDLRMFHISVDRKVFSADGFKCGCDWTKAVFSPDGRYVMAGSSDGTLFIWDVNSGNLEKSLNEQHRSSVNAVAWSLSGEYVASVDRGKKAILWSEF